MPPVEGLLETVSANRRTKFAVTVSAEPTVCVQTEPLALSHPVQSLNRCPEAAVAVSFTRDPESTVSPQSEPHETTPLVKTVPSPETMEPETVPPVEGLLETVSANCSTNAAPTVALADSLKAQVAVAVDAGQPVQLPNLRPDAAVAVSETSVPLASDALHTVRPEPAPQFRPLPATCPPVGFGETFTVKASGSLNATLAVLSESTATVQVAPVPEQAPPHSFTT